MKVLVRGKEGSRVAEKSSSQVSLTRRWFPHEAAVGQDSSCIIYSPCIIWMAPVYRVSSPAFNHNLYVTGSSSGQQCDICKAVFDLLVIARRKGLSGSGSCPELRQYCFRA
jgi:hypothetical protein